jgi:hypothetical protein
MGFIPAPPPLRMLAHPDSATQTLNVYHVPGVMQDYFLAQLTSLIAARENAALAMSEDNSSFQSDIYDTDI